MGARPSEAAPPEQSGAGARRVAGREGLPSGRGEEGGGRGGCVEEGELWNTPAPPPESLKNHHFCCSAELKRVESGVVGVEDGRDLAEERKPAEEPGGVRCGRRLEGLPSGGDRRGTAAFLVPSALLPASQRKLSGRLCGTRWFVPQGRRPGGAASR